MTGTETKVVVLGDGSWGTALALVLAWNGVPTTLWANSPSQAEALRESRFNARYLPGVPLPDNLQVTADPFEAGNGAGFALSVVPTQYLRSVVERFEDALGGTVPIASATKGIEIETFRTPTQVIAEVLGDRPIAVLSGPSHAEEVAKRLPASLVVASQDEAFAERVQKALSGDVLRVYTRNDPTGVELAAALKNVIAIAAGIADGLELGDNAKAALVSRGMVEMARFGRMHGARPDTFFGLAGIGDLATTCYSRHSRNRGVGEAIGRGKSIEEVLGDMTMVAEGVWTTRALFGPESEARGVSMPIAEEVHAILFDGKDPRQAVADLMSRQPTSEMEDLL